MPKLATQRDPRDLLPSELWLHCFSFLPPDALCALAPTCHVFNNLSSDKVIWRSFFDENASLVPESDTWKIMFLRWVRERVRI